jgi:hypothetical protein
MSNKKFIGGGFPGIKECINEKNVLTKEIMEKREFSTRKLIPISQILAKRNKQSFSDEITIHSEEKKQYNSSDDELNIVSSEIQPNFLHNTKIKNIEINKNFDINLINAPIKRKIKRHSKKTSNKTSKRHSKKTSKRHSKKTSKRHSKKTSKRHKKI